MKASYLQMILNGINQDTLKENLVKFITQYDSDDTILNVITGESPIIDKEYIKENYDKLSDIIKDKKNRLHRILKIESSKNIDRIDSVSISYLACDSFYVDLRNLDEEKENAFKSMLEQIEKNKLILFDCPVDEISEYVEEIERIRSDIRKSYPFSASSNLGYTKVIYVYKSSDYVKVV